MHIFSTISILVLHFVRWCIISEMFTFTWIKSYCFINYSTPFKTLTWFVKHCFSVHINTLSIFVIYVLRSLSFMFIWKKLLEKDAYLFCFVPSCSIWTNIVYTWCIFLASGPILLIVVVHILRVKHLWACHAVVASLWRAENHNGLTYKTLKGVPESYCILDTMMNL